MNCDRTNNSEMGPFQSLEEARRALMEEATKSGFDWRVSKPKKNYVSFVCHRAGTISEKSKSLDSLPSPASSASSLDDEPPNPAVDSVRLEERESSPQEGEDLIEKVSKIRSSRITFRCNCPATASIKMIRNDRDNCRGMFKIDFRNEHNHEPLPPQLLRRVPKLPKTLREQIVDSSLIAQPAMMYKKIRKDHPEVAIQKRDISDVKYQERQKAKGGETPLNLMLKMFADDAAISVKQDEGVLKALFISFKSEIKMLKMFSSILYIDATYCIIDWNAPLVNIVGRDCFGRSFCAGHCILTGETEEDYMWCMEVFKDLMIRNNIAFPETILVDRSVAQLRAVKACLPRTNVIICAWHIIVAVKARIVTTFRTARESGTTFNPDRMLKNVLTLLCTTDTQLFDRTVKAIQISSPRFWKYFDTQWFKYKEHWAKSLTAHFLTDGCRTTSRVESMNNSMKYHQLRRRPPIDLFCQIHKETADERLFQYNLQCIKARQGSYRILPALGHLIHDVSQRALEKIQENHSLADECCSGTFTRDYGLPCKHAGPNYLKLNYIHPMHQLQEVPADVLLFEPVNCSLIEPEKVNNKTSTKAGLPKVLQRCCSLCHEPGHDKRKCKIDITAEEIAELRQNLGDNEPSYEEELCI